MKITWHILTIAISADLRSTSDRRPWHLDQEMPAGSDPFAGEDTKKDPPSRLKMDPSVNGACSGDPSRLVLCRSAAAVSALMADRCCDVTVSPLTDGGQDVPGDLHASVAS
jgi:hypothetical protein